MPQAGPVIDAHHHLWDLSLGRHPWITSESGAIKALGDVGFLRRDYLIPDLVAAIGGHDVVGSVYVEAAWDRSRPPIEEVAWVESLAWPRRLAHRIVARAPLRDPEVEAVLETLAAREAVVGLRETVRWHPDPSKAWVARGITEDPAWRRGLAAAARHGLMLDLLMNPYQAEEVAALAAAMPGQTFIVNHCGTPLDRDAEGMDRWRRGLRAMAARPNVAIKVSNFGGYDRSPEGMRATVLTCIDAFGTDRAMFGTDWPVSRRHMEYGAICDAFAAAIAGFTLAEQCALLHDNAHRIYRFAQRSA